MDREHAQAFIFVRKTYRYDHYSVWMPKAIKINVGSVHKSKSADRSRARVDVGYIPGYQKFSSRL